MIGVRDAFSELVKRYKGPVFSVARQIIDSEETAEDIAQEVFLRAYRNIVRLKNPAKFFSWIYSITRHLALRESKAHVKRSAREPILYDNSRKPNPTELAENSESKRCIRSALKRIPGAYRLILELRYWHEMKITDIAAFLSIPEATVKWKLQKAKLLLKRELENTGIGEGYGKRR
jgi:RNA polymerase sigma-70 factor (ECF subfamily)